MNAREPTTIDPTGAPSPLLKQTDTESKHCAIRCASARTSPPVCAACATAALNRRAPSRCVGRPLRRGEGGRTYQEALHKVATGETVWTTHEGLFHAYRHPGVVHRPLSGLPPANGALVWRADTESAKVRAFTSLAAQIRTQF